MTFWLDPDEFHPASDRRWLQVNCALIVEQGADGPAPSVPWARLGEAVAAWHEEGLFERFFFVRKPPGLRLRFAVADRDQPGRSGPAGRVGAGLRRVLAAWLAEAEAGHEVRGFRFTVYEPETYRFGGRAGMDIAHDLFDADARAALEYERVAATSTVGASPFQLSATLSNALFEDVLRDQAEVWDVWCQLRDAVLGSPLATAARAAGAPEVGPTMVGGEGLPAWDHALERTRSLALVLRSTAAAGLLTVGIRAWLVSATVFHWNRWGLPLRPAALLALTEQMVDRLSPERR